MFSSDITADKLFNDPQLLAQYLDDISLEIEVPYTERQASLSKIENTCIL